MRVGVKVQVTAIVRVVPDLLTSVEIFQDFQMHLPIME